MQQLDARPAMLADRDLPPLLAPLARSSRRLGWRRDAMVHGVVLSLSLDSFALLRFAKGVPGGSPR